MRTKNSTKNSTESYFTACDGVAKKPLPCLLAAREGAKPSIFCMFWTNKHRFHTSLSSNNRLGTANALTEDAGINLSNAIHSYNIFKVSWGLALADYGRDPSNSDSLRGSRNFFVW